jgi:hypothetical protein
MNNKEINMPIDNKLEEKLYSILDEFANYLNELAITHRLFSASTASAFIYAIQEHITSKTFKNKFKKSLFLVLKMEMEHKAIVSTSFYQAIQSIQALKEEDWTRIIVLLELALSEKVDLESMVNQIPSMRKQVQIGRSAKPEHGNDIVFPNDKTLSRVHLVVSIENAQYFLEDRSANGTFINGTKVEKGVKVLVSIEDEIRIGREGTLVDLHHYKITKLVD